jgi:Flp pilus assembly protein TadD
MDDPFLLVVPGGMIAENGSDALAEITIDQAVQLAVRHYQAGHFPQAEQLCQLGLTGQPNHAGALNLLGMLAGRAERNDLALAYFQRAVGADPASADYQSNLGNALLASGRMDDAITAYQKAIHLQPNLAELHNNLGSALARSGQLDAAIAAHRTAIALKPTLVEAYSNLGNALVDQCRIDEAIAAHRTAVELQPYNAEIHWNLANCLLLNGDYTQGWREFEWRSTATLPRPIWDGGALAGRSILLRAEQGLGDTLQFIRYVQRVREKEGRILIECQPELVRLLRQLEGVSQWIPRGAALPHFDTWCPLMSLPFIFRTTLECIPMPIPLHSKTYPRQARRKVGLVWAGRSEHGNDRNRSIPFSMFQPLLDTADIQFFSLQKGRGAVAVANKNLVDRTHQLHDFADTAALISELDLVISVDTAVAHLAGTMGKPVWLMLPFSPDWRWMLNRNDSPWYPSMRLFRQSRPGDWRDVLRRVAMELNKDGFHVL